MAKKVSHHHTGRMHRGENMHIGSKTGKDAFRSPGPHAGPTETHIGHGYAPPEEYEDGGETENETCEHD